MNAKANVNKVWKVISKQKAVIAILALMVMMLFFNTTFYTAYNWLDMLRSTAILEIVAFGVTVAVICGGCDLSCGGTLCLGGIIAVMMVNNGTSIPVAVITALLSGAVVGFINGFLVVHQKTEPFIITLGMGMLLKGICQQLTDAHPLTCKSKEFMQISNMKFFGSVPSLVVYMLILFIIFYCVMRFTSFGRNCYAIGGNYEVAKYSGIKVVPIKWAAFVISGVVSTLAGVLLSSRMNTGSSVYGDTTGMLVNCGVVIGGTSFAGGVGGMVESFIGLFVIQLLTNCMNQLGVDSYYQRLCEGILIVIIIGSDCFGRKLKRERV
ncbi:MAG: ABC transporter permease [Lachnospiraceae bacterium]|jgi:ribose transport system permease protein|uniref:ABC transporter permease n=1 Tax=Candidatus Merdisoma sp. JLR.KK006 TaxID=3112626 RepID=UPI002FF227EF|nr:ABC transporter permease [Lachnospiraceae bacterium]